MNSSQAGDVASSNCELVPGAESREQHLGQVAFPALDSPS